MLTFGERFKKKQKYFLNLCPDIPLGEQTELRDIGMGQLQIMTSTIVAAGSMSESTPYLNFFTAAISEILNAVSTRKEIISGDYFDKPLTDEERANMDAIYIEDMKTLITCRDNNLYPPYIDIAISDIKE